MIIPKTELDSLEDSIVEEVMESLREGESIKTAIHVAIREWVKDLDSPSPSDELLPPVKGENPLSYSCPKCNHNWVNIHRKCNRCGEPEHLDCWSPTMPTTTGSPDERCEACDGEGSIESYARVCPACHGTGRKAKGEGGEGWTGKPCPTCKGSGEDDEARNCGMCAGTGEEYRTVKPTPPPADRCGEVPEWCYAASTEIDDRRRHDIASIIARHYTPIAAAHAARTSKLEVALINIGAHLIHPPGKPYECVNCDHARDVIQGITGRRPVATEGIAHVADKAELERYRANEQTDHGRRMKDPAYREAFAKEYDVVRLTEEAVAANVRDRDKQIEKLTAEVARLREVLNNEVMPRYIEMFVALGLGNPKDSVVVQKVEAALAGAKP